MTNWINKIIDIYLTFIDKKTPKKIIETLMIIWVSLILLLYCYYHQYFNFLLLTILLFFVPLIILKLFFGTGKEKSLYFFEKIKKYLPIKDQYSINIKYLFILIPIFAVLLTNLILLFIPLDEYNFNIFLFYELNILQKIFSLYIFYSLVVLLVYATGRKILSFFKFYFDSKLELFIFSVGIGFIPFMLGIFFIALTGWLYAWVIWIFIIFLFIFSFKELKLILKELSDTNIILSFKNKFLSFKSLTLIGLLFLLTINFIIITKPLPTDSDSMHTYFNAPNLYVNYHQFKPLMYYGGSGMGQNTEMIYASIMSILDSSFIIHLPLLFFILSIIGFYVLLKKLFNEKHAIFGILAIYFIPMNFSFIITSKVDTLLLFYSLLILFSLFFYYKNNFNSKFIYILGIFSGIALGIKYSAALVILPLYIAVLIILLIKKRKNIIYNIKPLILSSLLLILFFSPWAIKNQIYFNNIIYPFEFLGFNNKDINSFSSEIEFIKYRKERGKEVASLKYSYNKNGLSVTKFLENTWDQSIGKNVMPARSHNFGYIPLLIIPFYFIYYNKKIIFSLLIPLLYFIMWYYLGGGRPYYAFTGYIMLYALLPYLFLKSKKLLYLYLPFAFIITLTNFLIFTHNINYLAGKKNMEKYALSTIPHFGTAQYINNLNLTPDKKIIIVGDYKTAYINRNDQLIKYIDPNLPNTGYLLSLGEDYFYNYLRKNSVKYIIHSKLYTMYNSWPTFKGISLDEYLSNYKGKIPSIYEDTDRIKIFLDKNTQLIFDDGYYKLYKLN